MVRRHAVGAVTFTSTPAIHSANRGLFDRNETLWTGFALESEGKKIWFVGDTGLGPVFERDVVNRIAPVDITLTPTGAFLPRAVMRAVHTTPEEGLKLAEIMGSKTAIGMHWGTFPLTEDSPLEAFQRFSNAPGQGIRKIMMRMPDLDLRAPVALFNAPPAVGAQNPRPRDRWARFRVNFVNRLLKPV